MGIPLTDAADVKKIDRKARLAIPHQPVPKQAPAERVHNWLEVYEGYDLPAAKIEAERCIQCPAAPCQVACPLHNDIPGAFLKLEDGDVAGAADIFRQTNPAPDMCGRLCPQESLCEGHCVVGKKAIPVAIGRLEAFIADYERDHGGRAIPDLPPPTGKDVAVIGAGPAGFAVAEAMARAGHGVKIFEAWPNPGGVLRYGIPNFKMDKRHVDEMVDYLHALGVQFHYDVRIGYDITIDELFTEGYQAVFIGHGAGQGNELKIPSEDLPGIYQASDFLVRTNLGDDDLPPHMRERIECGKNVVVIGGGDTSMDCVRSAVRTGAKKVSLVYRRSEAEMQGREEERRHAKEEGVQFVMETMPVRFIATDDGSRLAAVRFQKISLGEPDADGRRKPVPVLGSEFDIPADTAVVAIGYKVEKLIFQTTGGLEATEWGTIKTDEAGRTSREGVFAAGDNVRGADLVVTALADAKRTAIAIDEFLRSK